MMNASDDSGSILDWSVRQPDQIWQAVRNPYLCTIVRPLDDDGGFYATIVRSGDLSIIVLEYAASLGVVQAWCAGQIEGLWRQ